MNKITSILYMYSYGIVCSSHTLTHSLTHTHTPTHTHTHTSTCSYDTHSLEVTVIDDLLSLPSLNESHTSIAHSSPLQYARIMIKLAAICRTCHVSRCSHTCYDPPLSLLTNVVEILEPFISNLAPPCSHTLPQAHQHLATAYLWRAICTLEQQIRSEFMSGIYTCIYMLLWGVLYCNVYVYQHLCFPRWRKLESL